MNNSIKSVVSIMILIVIVGFCSLKFYREWKNFLETPIIAKNQTLHYFFSNGETIKTLAAYLQKNANLKHPTYLVWYAELKGDNKSLKAGEYLFAGPMTPNQLLAIVKNGDVVQHEITFVDGWTFNQILQKLEQNKNIKHELSSMRNDEILLKLNIKQNYLEGMFFPDTYKYIYGSSDIEILQRAHHLMQNQLSLLWKSRAQNLPYKNSYQALIAASLIQKESGLVAEQPLIASVIVNRLQKHMSLQIDPTVIYALGANYNGSLSASDMKFKSPFNTYVNKGLPPSPICMPGLTAIDAALHPATTHYLYFVANGQGGHDFSRTLAAHDVAIKKYLLNKNKKTNETTKS